MRKINKFDKLLIILMLLLTISIFVLAGVIKSEGGSCVVNPCGYLEKNKKTGSCVIVINEQENIISNINISSLKSEYKDLNKIKS